LEETNLLSYEDFQLSKLVSSKQFPNSHIKATI